MGPRRSLVGSSPPRDAFAVCPVAPARMSLFTSQSILEVSRRYNAHRAHVEAHAVGYPPTALLQARNPDGSPPCKGGQGHECPIPRGESRACHGHRHHGARRRLHRGRRPNVRSRPGRAGPSTSVRRKRPARRATRTFGGAPRDPIRSRTRRPSSGPRSRAGSIGPSWTSGCRGPRQRPDREAGRRNLRPDHASSSPSGWDHGRCAGRRRRTTRPGAWPPAISRCRITSGRMSALEDGRSRRETGRAAGGPVEPNPPRASAEVARFFRPIDEWGIDRIVPSPLQSERPLNPLGVAVTPAEQVEIAGRVYHAILDEAVDRFLAAPREGEHDSGGGGDLRRPARRAAGILVGPLEAIPGRCGPGSVLAIVGRGTDSRARAGRSGGRCGRTSSG